MSGLSGGLSNPNSYGNGCVLDNMPADCTRALLMLNHGAAEPQGGRGTSLGWRFVVEHGGGEFRDSYYYFGNIGPGGQRNTTVNPQNTATRKTSCTFNINLTNRSRVQFGKEDLAAIEKELNRIFETAGHKATLNKPGAASNPAFNYNLTVYNAFPVNWPQNAKPNDVFGYTRSTRQIPNSAYPNIYFPGPVGGVSVNHVRASYGKESVDPAALSYIVSGVGAHEMIAHYLLTEPRHPDEYKDGITAEGFDYRTGANRSISDAVKKELDKICSSGQLPQ